MEPIVPESFSEGQNPSFHTPNTTNYTDYVEGDYTQDYEESAVAITIQRYFIPILVVLGLFGNVFLVLLMRQKNLNNWSVCFYITMYAIGNILILLLTAGLQWVTNEAEVRYIANLADWGCKLWEFILRVVTYSGIWFIVAMVVDQYIFIWHPLRAALMCTVFMAKFAVVMILIGLVVISIHAMWTFELLPNGCYILHTPDDLHALIWPWVAASFYTIIPLIVLCIFITAVIIGAFTKHPWKETPSHYQVPCDITYTIIALATLFVVFATPATILNIIQFSLPTSWLHNMEFMQQLKIGQTVGHFLSQLNPVVAFYVCVIFSGTFRQELKQMLNSSCLRRVIRVYEMQVNANGSSTHLDCEQCSETTPL